MKNHSRAINKFMNFWNTEKYSNGNWCSSSKIIFFYSVLLTYYTLHYLILDCRWCGCKCDQSLFMFFRDNFYSEDGTYNEKTQRQLNCIVFLTLCMFSMFFLCLLRTILFQNQTCYIRILRNAGLKNEFNSILMRIFLWKWGTTTVIPCGMCCNCCNTPTYTVNT